MGVMYVKKDGSVDDVAVGWDNSAKEFKGSNSGEGLILFWNRDQN